jgi:hypothetical protein
VIDTLEIELENARRLMVRYEAGELPATSMVPLRHFCAELVETAIELARHVAEGTASEPASSAQRRSK